MRALLIACLLVPLLSGCISEKVGAVDGRLVEGCTMEVDTPRSGIVRNLKEWIAFWSDHCVGKRPNVDFDNQLVAFDAWGRQPNTGYGIELQEARVDGDALGVMFRRVAPGENCFTGQAETFPTAVAIIDARRDAAFVDYVVETRNCA